MSPTTLFLADLIAITVLTFVLYFRRHRRRDLVVAYLGLNMGALAVASALTSAGVGLGVGLGLFGVLSIIRLRSAELDQREIAYYFSALALGLLGAIELSPPWLALALMSMIVAVMAVGDHPRLFSRYRRQLMHLDTAFTDESALVEHLEPLLGARLHAVTIQKVDLVRNTTSVDVRFELPASPTRPRSPARAGAPSAPSGDR